MGKQNFGFKRGQKPVYHFEFGGGVADYAFAVDFFMKEGSPKDCYMQVKSALGMFDFKLQGYTYWYLMESARQGIEENIHGFCATMSLVAGGVYQDEEFSQDIISAVMRYSERLIEKAKITAGEVTDEQEQMSQTIMEDVAKFAELESDQERDALRERWKEEMRDEMSNQDNQENQDGDKTDNQPNA